MNARLQNINEINQMIHDVEVMEHTLQNFNDDLTNMLVENRLVLTHQPLVEGFWSDLGSGISSAASWVGDKVVSGAKAVGSGVKSAYNYVASKTPAELFHGTMDVIQGAAAAISLASYSSVIGAPVGLIASIVDCAIDVGYAVGHTIDAGIKYAKGDKEAGWDALKSAGGRAAWAAVGLIPIAGDIGTMGKLAGKTAKTIDAVVDGGKAVKQIGTVAGVAGDLNKAFNVAGDVSKAVDAVAGAGKTIKTAADIVDTSRGATKIAQNMLKTVGKMPGLKALGGFADNYRVAQGVFATMDNASTISKVMSTSGDITKAVDILGTGGKAIGWGADVAGQTKKFTQLGGATMDILGGSRFAGKGNKVAGNMLRRFALAGPNKIKNMFKGTSLLTKTTDMVGNAGKLMDVGTKVDYGLLAKSGKFVSDAFKGGIKSSLKTTNIIAKSSKLPQLTQPFGTTTYGDIEGPGGWYKEKDGRLRSNLLLNPRALYNLGGIMTGPDQDRFTGSSQDDIDAAQEPAFVAPSAGEIDQNLQQNVDDTIKSAERDMKTQQNQIKKQGLDVKDSPF